MEPKKKKTRPRYSKIAIAPADRNTPQHSAYVFIRCVPNSTKQAFKTACAAADPQVTMRDAIIQLMRDFAQKHGIVEGPTPEPAVYEEDSEEEER
jgi:hypothetical protein